MREQAGELDKRRHSFLLSPLAMAHLNRRVRRHGDISRLVLEAVDGVDLAEIPLQHRPKVRGTQKADLRPRQMVLPVATMDRLAQQANARGASLNVLVDAAVCAYFSPRSSPPAPTVKTKSAAA